MTVEEARKQASEAVDVIRRVSVDNHARVAAVDFDEEAFLEKVARDPEEQEAITHNEIELYKSLVIVCNLYLDHPDDVEIRATLEDGLSYVVVLKDELTPKVIAELCISASGRLFDLVVAENERSGKTITRLD